MDTKMMQLVAVIDKQVGETKKGYWTKIGVAFENKDGKGFNVQLTAIPVSGKLVMRLHEPRQDT